MIDELSEKARRFAQEYLIDFKASRAAERAGLDPRAGSVLLHDPRIDALIREGKRKASERINIGVDNTLESFRIMRDVVASDFFEMKEIMIDGMPGAPPIPTGRFYMALKSLDDWTDEMKFALKSIKHGPNGPEVVLHDKLAANSWIGKYLEMFKETKDVRTGGLPGGVPIEVVTREMDPKKAAEAYATTLQGGS